MTLLGILGKWGRYCDICGTRMVHFRHPSRWRCPKESSHGPIIADMNRTEGYRQGGRNRAARARRDSKGKLR